MLAKSNFSFLGGTAFFHPPPPPQSIILAVLVIKVYKLFWGNKSKFVGQTKMFFDGKQKMTKIFGFEIFKSLTKANFEQFWKSSFLPLNLLSFSKVIFFVIFVFFWKNYFWLVVDLDFWLNVEIINIFLKSKTRWKQSRWKKQINTIIYIDYLSSLIIHQRKITMRTIK